MKKEDTYKDILPTAVEVEVEPTQEVLDIDGLDKINESFGKGVNKRKMLVTKGITLKELVKAINE